jgi:uncharacterized peroxidase-related enzyme
MTQFAVHNKNTASDKARDSLQNAEIAFGFVPNLIGVLSESPAAAKAYLELNSIFGSTSFTPSEQQVVLLAISRYHECHYCIAAHSTVAQMQKVPSEVLDAIRNDQRIPDDQLEALRTFATTVVDKRGWVSQEDLDSFFAAGYDKHHVLDVIVGAAQKTISNYTNHISETPVDKAFEAHRWSPPTENLKAV